MVDKLTEDIADTLDRAYGPEKCVSDGTKQRFVSLAGSGHFTMTELCRDFGISRQTENEFIDHGLILFQDS